MSQLNPSATQVHPIRSTAIIAANNIYRLACEEAAEKLNIEHSTVGVFDLTS